jgi:signal transduction histidine kinase
MLTTTVFAELLGKVVREEETTAALTELLDSARTITRSRNALIALLDDEQGHLEIQLGCGPDWSDQNAFSTVEVSVGSRRGITGYVAATGKPFVTGDVSEVPAYRQLFASTRSEMAVPVMDRFGHLRAVINLESDLGDAYGEGDIAAAEAIGHIAALILERDENHLHEQALVEVGTSIAEGLTETDILDKVIDIAGRVLRFQACSIFLLDPHHQHFVLRASTGNLRDQVGQLTYEPNEGFTGWVCAQGQPILLHDPQSDPRWRGKYTEIPADQIASFLAVPIMSRGRSVGAIRVLRRFPDNEFLDNRFTDHDAKLLHAVADQLGVGLENIRSLEKLIHSERMTAWGELSAKSSHMIGNRVFALRGDLNELEYQLRSDQPNVEALRELQRGLQTNVTRLQEILQEFRDFVTATQLNRNTACVNEAVKETVSEVFPKRTNIQLVLDLSDQPLHASLDLKRFRLALSELIENAISFMDNGELCVSTQMADPEIVRQAKLPHGKHVAITVADTGPGVPTASKEAIFQPFYSSRVKGMGLGLSIVKGIIDAHGGTVIEAGQEGSGAKFVMLVPALDRPTSVGNQP